MPRMENNGGDVLARGGAFATFKPMGANVTKEKWEEMSQWTPTPAVMAKYLFQCPVHGLFRSEREFVLSGDGFPKRNEYAEAKCPKDDCGEKSTYAGYYQDCSDVSAQIGTDGSVIGEASGSDISLDQQGHQEL